MEIKLRKALEADARQTALIHRQAVKVAMPYLPDLHTPEEDLQFFRHNVFQESEVWVAESPERIVAFCAFEKGWINHLYVLPGYQGQGIGKRLLAKAMEQSKELCLWAFQRNKVARDFYESHGFTVLEMTDGKDNEEKEPDVLYQWKPTSSLRPAEA